MKQLQTIALLGDCTLPEYPAALAAIAGAGFKVAEQALHVFSRQQPCRGICAAVVLGEGGKGREAAHFYAAPRNKHDGLPVAFVRSVAGGRFFVEDPEDSFDFEGFSDMLRPFFLRVEEFLNPLDVLAKPPPPKPARPPRPVVQEEPKDDDFTEISRIGKESSRLLREAGLRTFEDLRKVDRAVLDEIGLAPVALHAIDAWLSGQAEQKAEEPEHSKE